MDEVLQYETYLRERITELRGQRGISEHRLSLELGKSGSYIRSITSGATMPSMKELFNIMAYFEVSPSEFFSGLSGKNTLRVTLGEFFAEGELVPLTGEQRGLLDKWALLTAEQKQLVLNMIDNMK